MLWLILIVPGVVVAYFFFLRPILKALPALKSFYADADTFWAKIKALSWNSLTIAWSYFLIGVGVVLQFIEPLASALGDPDIKFQITNALKSDPKILGYFAMAVSIITIAARLRSITKAS